MAHHRLVSRSVFALARLPRLCVYCRAHGLSAASLNQLAVSRYRIKCRCRIANIFSPSAPLFGGAFGQSHGASDDGDERFIKIFLSLYKVQASIYLLDFQKMEGNPFDFMTLCARIITELKALSQVRRLGLAITSLY